MNEPANYIRLNMHLSKSKDPSQPITEEDMDSWMHKVLQWVEKEGEYECAYGMWSLVDEEKEEEE